MSGWEDSWTNYAVEVANLFQVKKEDVLYSLTLTCVPNALNESYKVLVRNGTLTPIEDLAQEEKKSLWNQAGTYQTNKDMRIIVSRSLYLLDKLTRP